MSQIETGIDNIGEKLITAVPSGFKYPQEQYLFNDEVVKVGKKQKSKRYVEAFGNYILFFKGQSKVASKQLKLSFENAFSVLRDESEEVYGFKIELGEQEFEFHVSQNVGRWRQYFRDRINQRGFHESFKAHKKIGKGNFASVYLADRLEDRRSFAIKAFSKEVAYAQDNGKQSLINEIQIMRELNHPSIIRLHEVYETANSLYMVLDLLEGGSLYEKIKHRPTFNHEEIEVMMKLLLQGLEAMHGKNIMHRDLKPENILFRKSNQIETVCIADFGLATHADQDKYLFVRCGTPGFVAPEVVNCKDPAAKYDPVCDVFSIGLIFYILLTGKPAFPGKSYNDVLIKNRKCDIVLDGKLFDNVPSVCFDLLKRMLERDPKKRITAKLALQHAYFHKHSPQDELRMDDDEDVGIDHQIQKMREESTKFNMARINQLQNSPINSPIIAATSRFKKPPNEELQMQQPLFTGKTDSIQGSPESVQFNSPSAQKSKFQQISLNRPSKFKDLTGDKTQDFQGQEQQQQQHHRVGSNNNPLHRYALMNQNQQNHEEEQKNARGRKENGGYD